MGELSAGIINTIKKVGDKWHFCLLDRGSYQNYETSADLSSWSVNDSINVEKIGNTFNMTRNSFTGDTSTKTGITTSMYGGG